ncbi:MAG: phosphatidate cytidylyltransferase [Chloroflexi bacterium]|nr:phosphatidate cytidylyltransferase [Chloroflexota bacterium]
MTREWVAVVVSFAYVFAMIGIAELLRKWRGYSVDFTRKFIHVAVGMWAYGTVVLFRTRALAIMPPLAFVAINAFSYWQGTFKAMETQERGQLGTVYFPLAFAALIWLFWGRPDILVASLMPMTWGDALAAVIGGRFGRRHYTVCGHSRTVEGSLTMFLASWTATAIPFLVLGPTQPGLPGSLAIAAAVALPATLVEAVSPWGIDNLSVPTVSALILAVLVR